MLAPTTQGTPSERWTILYVLYRLGETDTDPEFIYL